MPNLTRPAIRLAKILTMLKAAPHETLPSSRFWQSISDYDGGSPSGRRVYRRDIKTLRERGLIISDLTIREIGANDRDAVRLCFFGKPDEYVLSAEEHEALRAARTRHPRSLPQVLPGTAPGTSPLDLAVNAVRILEETGQRMDLPDLAAELDSSPEAVLQALKIFDDIEAGSGRLIDLGCDEEDGADEQTDPPAHLYYASLPFSSRRSNRSLRNQGLDLLGRFAYNSVEVADRLALIEQALPTAPSSHEEGALWSARQKLEAWGRHLSRAERQQSEQAS